MLAKNKLSECDYLWPPTGSMGRMLRYPVPKIPDSCIAGLEDAVGSLEEQSSVASHTPRG